MNADVNADLVVLLARAADSTARILGSLGSQVRGRQSPCPELNVEQVFVHLVGGIRGFTVVGEGGELDFGEELDSDAVVGAPDETFLRDVGRLLEVFGEPGRLDAIYSMPWGPTTGTQLLGFELIEVVVHGWDIARGLGVDPVFDQDVVDATLAGARLWVDESVRVPQMFGPEVRVADGSSLDALVAFLGRDPAWSNSRP